MKHLLFLLIILKQYFIFSQVEYETPTPFNIKTVSFVQNEQNVSPFFQFGDTVQLQFDDLFGNEANYYYEIVHCDYDWKPSTLSKSEYLDGFDNQRIMDYANSFNTLQNYSHYIITFPNQYTRLKLPGNYLLKILNENKDLVFSRRFVLYNEMASIEIQVKRPRIVTDMDSKQNLEFSIKSKTITFQNPMQNIKVLLLQNGRWNTSKTNIKPQYTLGNDLVYNYNTETLFYGGNEYFYFENKNIRATGNYIGKVDTNTPIYIDYLYPNPTRAFGSYSNVLDVNGKFVVQNINATNNNTESDYVWVCFNLAAPNITPKNIYVGGLFNNYSTTPEYKMEYNEKTNRYEKSILIKQGFTSYIYTVLDEKGTMDYENNVDGNFYQTENDYIIIAYYKENSERYYRPIGIATANSLNIKN